MKRPYVAGAALLALLVPILFLLFVERIPAGHVGILESGGEVRVLRHGFHLRPPWAARAAVFPLDLPPARGKAEARLADGAALWVPFEISGRLDPDRAAAFHETASRHGVERVLLRAAEVALGETSASGTPEDLAARRIETAASRRAGELLAPYGFSSAELRLGPLDAPALLRLAQSLAPRRAAGLLREAIAAAASSGGGWEAATAMGLVLESERNPRGAETQYLDALSMNPTALPPMAQLVAIYSAVGEYRKLDRLLETALEQDPNSVQHLNWMALSRMKQGRLEDAEGFFRRAGGVEPGNPVVLNNLGGVQLKQGRLAEAVATFRAAVTAAPEDRQSLYNLGIALCAQGRWREGLPHLLGAERAGAPAPEILRAIARAYRETGQEGRAVDYERRAAAAAPSGA
jgi:tetratricopeptide (TPR) repeat protein